MEQSAPPMCLLVIIADIIKKHTYNFITPIHPILNYIFTNGPTLKITKKVWIKLHNHVYYNNNDRYVV